MPNRTFIDFHLFSIYATFKPFDDFELGCFARRTGSPATSVFCSLSPREVFALTRRPLMLTIPLHRYCRIYYVAHARCKSGRRHALFKANGRKRILSRSCSCRYRLSQNGLQKLAGLLMMAHHGRFSFSALAGYVRENNIFAVSPTLFIAMQCYDFAGEAGFIFSLLVYYHAVSQPAGALAFAAYY